MGKGNESKTAGLAMIGIVTVTLAAVYFGVLGSFGAWLRRYEAWQYGLLLIALILLAALFGLYHRRETSRLRQENAERQREVAELEREVADLRRTKDALGKNETRYRDSPMLEAGGYSDVLGVATDVTERKEAEDRLRAAEARYRTLVEQVPAITYIEELSEKGKRLTYISPQYEATFGYSPESDLSYPEHWLEVVHPDDRERLLAEDMRTDETLKPFKAEYRMFAKDGRTVWIRDEAVVVRGEGGRPLFWQGVMFDVTERKEAERELEESQRRLSTLLSNAPAYLYRCRNEPEWPNEFVSDHAFELTGYTPEELTDGSVMYADLIVEEDRERVWEEVQAGLAERRRFELWYSVRRRDGVLRHVEERGQGVYGEGGKVEAIEGVVYDVTDRVRAEEALRDAEERYRTLVERIPAVTFVDRVGSSEESLYVSPQIEGMLGYTPEEWIAGRLWRERLHPEDLERVLASDERFEATGGRVDEEYRLLAKDGSVVWVREETVLVRGEGDEPLYVQGIMSDVTERKETEERVRASELELRVLFEAMTDLIFEIDWEGRYLKIAPTNPSLLYRPPGELLGKTLHEIMPTEQADMFRDHIRRALQTRRKVDTEYSLTIGDKEVWFAGTIAPMAEDRVVFVARDITERRRAEEALRKSRAGLAEAQRMAHFGNWEWEPKTGDTYWSDETFRIYGFEPQSFVPTFEKLLEVVHPEDRKMLGQALEGALYDDRPYDFEHRVVKPDGEVRVVHRRAEVVRDESGEPTRMVGTVHDVTERKALEEQLQHQAMHDRLTGLPNRALFTDRLRQALARAKRRDGDVAVLFMDLDNFKVVNDSLGHKAGDRLLVTASKRIRALLRPEDTVARLGGDEFVFLLEDTDTQGAVRVAERVLDRLREPFNLGRRRLVFTASIGVAAGGADGKYAADLLRDADLAMYRAKRSGKARHAVFEEAMNAEALERLELEHDLRRGIERGELRVHYQPQVRLDADLQRSLRAAGSRAIVSPGISSREPSVTGVEALVRWEHPERGLLLPRDFVPVAEETGLIVPMGEAVLEEACRQAKDWQGRFATDPPLTVYVNLSARQFREPDLTGTVSRVLRETDLDPACLHLEITETTAMSDAPATVSTLEELKALGVRLVIDDFGTGYSSLSYLQRFPVDYVKIDRSFVGDLEGEPEAIALVSGMIRLAHALGIEVIAEGVERAGQLERLESMGCDVAQGYYFSGPLPSEAMGALLGTEAIG